MKIKTIELPFEEVMRLPRPKHLLPKKPNIFFRSLVRIAANQDLKDVGFSYTISDDAKNEKGPFLILMNHSSFLDLEMASAILYPKPYNIICTTDAMVGKKWLMHSIGCVPTQKFVSDISLLKDISYALKHNKTSVLMYPEAGYSFEGCSVPLPENFAKLLKTLGVPVLFIESFGAFHRDPLYNNLQKRKVKVSCNVSLLASREDITKMNLEELEEKILNAFSFDHFKWQKSHDVHITENFRADGLERVLYKCKNCGCEDAMLGSGILLTCQACHSSYELTELGELKKGDTYEHIPAWYRWQREEVRQELEQNKYSLDTDVDICMLVDYKALYHVGEGHLHHDISGYVLDGCNGKLHYEMKPLSSHELNADYYWYEKGDIICIGDKKALYYCFPKKKGIITKTRLAHEELFKMKWKEVHSNSRD